MFGVQLAVYSLLPVEPLFMLTVVLVSPVSPVPLQPLNWYPTLAGLVKVNVGVSIL